MNKDRPINLDLTTIKFPVTAVASILHRISGVLLFLLIPFILWLFKISLDPNYFAAIKQIMQNPLLKFVIWVTLAGFIYHFIAGIRHLLMDLHVGDTKTGGFIGAWTAIGLSFILIILTGVWLWLMV